MVNKSLTFEVIVGSYEEFLLGYNFSKKECEFVQSFAAHDHSASVRCVASSDRYLASGGADDRIFIYDLKTRKEHCSLTYHNATITSLQFTENHTHLLSGSADGVLAIVRVGNWQLEKIWNKAHKGSAILDMAIHNSGKMALTLGADCTLCTWNLVKGRQAYVINLKSKSKSASSLEKIAWAPDGVRFALYGGHNVELWSIESGGILKHIEHDEKVTASTWLTDEAMLVGHENGQLTIVDTNDFSTVVHQLHNNRIKSVRAYKKWIVTISSSGEMKVWNKRFEEICKNQTGCRLTCLCVVPSTVIENKEDTEEGVMEIHQNPIIQKVARVVEIVEDSGDEPEFKKQKQREGNAKKKKKKCKQK